MLAVAMDFCSGPPMQFCSGVDRFSVAAPSWTMIVGQVLRFDLAALLAPKAEEGGLIVTHDDAGIRAPYE